MSTPFNVLFLCTGNSARSILAEALINQLPVSARKFRGVSVGSHPRGSVHPFALELLMAQRMSIDALRSKSWDEFAAPDAPRMDIAECLTYEGNVSLSRVRSCRSFGDRLDLIPATQKALSRTAGASG